MSPNPDTALRFIQCPACNGDREFEVVTGYDPRDGAPTGYREQCRECEGTGEIEAEAEPITLDDLEEAFG